MLGWVCAAIVMIAIVPVASGLFQFLLVAFSSTATHLEQTDDYLPRVSILIPAWNEGAVIGATVDRLMALNYPKDRLRVYVVDDGSIDQTPTIAIGKSKQYFGNVFHIRRVAGGEGKAHTLNYGLRALWASDWTQAVLIMDADVIYTPDSLAQMARHLADPEVGAVTAYIKEGSQKPNLVQRFITFEYVTATAASRRAQNVLGFLACLSGGAQLHSRENLMAIGGKIFSDTLAEDTFTTFKTQLAGRKALFEPNAIVYAEEPDSLDMLWKQRLRWARGNVQITQHYKDLWFNRSAHPKLGSPSMAILWFSIFLMPVFQISASLSLIVLYFLDAGLAWQMFRAYWIVASLVYVLVTLISYVIDWESSRKSWLEGIMFPGLVSFSLIVHSLFPQIWEAVAPLLNIVPGSGLHSAGVLFIYAWLALCMAFAWLAKWTESQPALRRLAPILLLFAGYGPFLCAVTLGAYIKEATGAARTWDKTEKTGKIGA